MKPLKIVLTLLLFCSLSVVNFAFAAPKAPARGHIQFNKITAAASPAEINCYRHNTDVCIINVSGEDLSFTIPSLNEYDKPLPSSYWVDANSYRYIDSLYVDISNTNFHQWVPNHSIIKIESGLAGSAQPVVKIIK